MGMESFWRSALEHIYYIRQELYAFLANFNSIYKRVSVFLNLNVLFFVGKGVSIVLDVLFAVVGVFPDDEVYLAPLL